jgi:hypothetical protein
MGSGGENALSVKLSLVIFDLLMSSSIIKLLIDLLTGKVRQKKNYPPQSIGISLGYFVI